MGVLGFKIWEESGGGGRKSKFAILQGARKAI